VTHLRLGPGAEFDRIRAVLAALGPRAHDVGDDCALLPEGPGLVAISSDLSIEDVHFRRAWLGAEEIGWRAAAAALSDLAAEGAGCVGVLASVALPRGEGEATVVALLRGVGEAVASVGGVVLGGDLTAAPVWLLDVVAVGRTVRPVRRVGARPGDGLWVSGVLGGARAALAAWEDGREPDARARAAFARPAPRLALGQWLAAEGAHAMLDLSDGLAGDARHLAAASGVRLAVELDRMPLHHAVHAEAARAGTAPARFAAEGGEDYELLVAMPPGFGTADAARAAATTGVPLTRIGAVEPGDGAAFTLGDLPVRLHGFDHFG
jgi:thiamine-monophosphate kinase